MIALNINLEKTLAKKINLMLNYYGGYCMSEVNENCTHAIVTSYNEAIFENLKKITNEKIKFITPDWIIDCIDTNSLIDETIYNPKYLTTNAENQNILLKISNNNEISTIVNTEDQDHANKSHVKSRNYVFETDNFFNQNAAQLSESTNQGVNKSVENKVTINDTLNHLPQTPNSKAKGKKSRSSKLNAVNQPVQMNAANKNKNGQTNATTSSTFNFDMNEIFQSVIGEAMNNSIVKPKPILLELIENKVDSTHLDTADNNTSLFSLYNEKYCTQENSHLINFSNCLLGCIFYLKTFENYYTNDTLLEWHKMIESYGGKVVDNYESNMDQITHVLCPHRNSNIYKMALRDEKRIVTQFWLEDVLEEEKLKPPWRAYHFPSVFERENGPLKNHVSNQVILSM